MPIVLFGGVFVAAGVIVLVVGTLRPQLALWAARDWSRTTCTLERSEVEAYRDSDGDAMFRPALRYRYEVDGRAYHGERATLADSGTSERGDVAALVARFPVGAEVPCFFDPDRPGDVVLERRAPTRLVAGLFGLGFALVGLGVIVSELRERPGRRRAQGAGRRVLPRRAGRGAPGLLIMGGFAAAFSAPPVFISVRGIGDLVFFAVFAAVALALQLWFWHAVLQRVGPRITVHATGAAEPGGQVDLEVDLRGWTSIRRIEVRLVDREERLVGRGEDATWESTTASSHQLARAMAPGRRVRLTARAALPADAAPTDAGDGWARSWLVVVDADVAWWPDVASEYELVVSPAARASSRGSPPARPRGER